MAKVLEWVNGEAVIRDEAADDRPAVPIEEARARAMKKVMAWATENAARITSRYVPAEVAAWPAKAADARKVAAGGDASLLIATEATALNVSPALLCSKIIAKAEAYETRIATLAAIRQKAEIMLAAAGSEAEVTAVLQTIKAGLPQ